MKSGEAPALSLCGTVCNWLDLLILGYLFAVTGVAERVQIRATVCCHVFRIGCTSMEVQRAVKGPLARMTK